ncbi:MAG: glycogen/starch synthase [Paludibacteraceae bacterium]|nr:glycogen/starch synthase [Paludibacteraceae bacterium]
MKEPKRILFISQEIYPYLSEETPMRLLNRQLPEYFQGHGFETRTFMPKFGEINERRNQLHEVIRLSGMNLIIEDSDHPLLIKVASIQTARIQIYFIDNDDLFHRRKGVKDEHGEEYADNDDRVIFYARGVIETVKKLRWTPDVILCSGWMSALAPLYLKRAFNDEPFFANSKVVLMLDDNEYKKPFSTKFTEKLRIDGITNTDVRSIAGFPVGYEELMRLAVDFSDAIVYATPQVNQRVANYAETKGKPTLPYAETENVVEACKRQYDFFKTLLPAEEESFIIE